jgi:hypothetical protein
MTNGQIIAIAQPHRNHAPSRRLAVVTPPQNGTNPDCGKTTIRIRYLNRVS